MLFVWFHIPYQESACRFENHACFTGRKSYSITNKRSYVSNKETTEHVKNNVINSKDYFHFKKHALNFSLRNNPITNEKGRETIFFPFKLLS